MKKREPFKVTKDPKETPQVRIDLHFIRNPKTGEADRIKCVPFSPGMIIERMGKRYRVDSKGTQHRI